MCKTNTGKHGRSSKQLSLVILAVLFFTVSAGVSSAGSVNYFNVNSGDTSLESLTSSLSGVVGTQSITPTIGVSTSYPEKFERAAFNQSTNLSGRWNFSVHFMVASGTKTVTGAPYAIIYKYEDGTETLLYNGSADKPTDKSFANTNTEFNWSQNLSNIIIGANAKIRVEIVFSVTNLGGGFASTVDLKYGTATYDSQVEITNKSAPAGVLSGTYKNVAPAQAKIGEKGEEMINFTLSSSSAGYVDVSTISVRLTGTSTNHSIRFIKLIRDDNKNYEVDPTDTELGIEEFNGSKFANFGTSGLVLDSLANSSSKNYFIEYDIASVVGTSVGETVGARIESGDITINLGSFGTMNYPYNSTNVTIADQPQDEAANIYGFLNKPVYLFGNYSGGEYTAGGGEDAAKPAVDDNVIWPGSANSAVLGSGTWKTAANQEYMIESTTIRAMLYVTDGRGRSKAGQRVNAWIINNLGQKINNSNVTDSQGRTTIEFWGYPDWGASTTSAKAWPTHSGQNLTVDGTSTTQEAQYIYAKFKSREYYYVYVDYDSDNIADYEMPFLAYTMYDTFPWPDKLVAHCESNDREAHDHQGNDFAHRAAGTDNDPVCADCHGWSKDAGPSPISVSVDPRPLIKYSTTHPFPKSSKALDCTESSCHPGYNQPSQPIPGWPAQTHIIKDESYPNASVCSTSGCHVSDGRALPYVDSITPKNDEGHCYLNDIPESTKGVSCKYCHNYNFHFQKEREKIPAFVLIPEGKTTNDGNYPGTCFEGCHITVAWHNNSVACQECHFNLSKAPMHQSNLKVDRKQCYQSCHGNYSVTQVKNKDNVSYLDMRRVWLNTTWRHSTELNNGSKWNASNFNKNNHPSEFYWNNSGSDFPQDACEFCHSNEHTGAVFIVKHPMGKLFQFNGYNVLNSNINHTSNWCSSCHWQGYKQNTTITWYDMFKAFNDTSLPIPPEISGNATYAPTNGSNSGANGVTAYLNHSDWFMSNGTGRDFSDAMCFDCHANGIKITDGHKMFQHNVTIGFGGPECSSCHNVTLKGVTEPNGIVRLDSRAIENTSWVHFNLSNKTGADKSYVRSIEASCWGCHNTSGGRPDPSEHPTSYKQPRNCTNCHVYGNYSAPIIVEHMPGGYNPSSEIKLRTPADYCTRCHNNSLLAYSSLNTTNFTSNTNATVGHYATNKTLMTAANTSKDCTWCHFSNSNNANWSMPVDPRTNYSLHTGKVNNDCYGCHVVGGATTVSGSGWTFHDASVKLGASGGMNCTNCHNSGTENKVNFTAVSMGMHATLNSGAQSTPANASNKPCWACHGTVNATSKLANESDQPVGNHTDTGITTYKNPKKCYDCHITASLNFTTKNVTDHIPSGYTTSTDVNTSSYNYTYCSYCHNNSVNSAYEPDSMGLSSGTSPMNASVSHYGANKTAGKLMYNSTGNTEDCVYCHRNSSNQVKWGILPGSLVNISNKNSSGGGFNHDSYTTSDRCGSCHGGYADTAGFTFHNASLGNGSGGGSGPDCKSCHNISDTDTGRGHIDYTVFNASIHGSINTTAGADENEGCWACHGSGASEGHNTTGDAQGKGKFDNPYLCADCHTSSGTRNAWAISKGALNVSEHYTNGSKIKASYNATATFSCLKCHQDLGEMMLPNGDTDYNKTSWSQGGDNYNATIGGNKSPYHYGAKRSTLNGSAQNTDGYCNYCHSNISSVFPYVNQHNKSIFEHTNTTNTSVDIKNTTSLNCNSSVCHGSGRIHNASLNKTAQTAWTSGQKDYCAPCHNSTGGANKKVYNQWHDPLNSSTDNITNCNYCHDTGSLGSTVLSYSLNIHSDNLTYPSNAVNCTGCHNVSSTYVKGKKILTHFPNASKDKGNTTLSARTCELCHSITGKSMHASGLVKKPSYGCADCHKSSGSGPYWANQSFSSYIDTTSHDNTSTSNVTNCEWCHNSSGAKAPFHFTPFANGSVSDPKWGGWQTGSMVNCTNCHDSSYNDQAPFYAPAKPHAGTGNNTDDCYSCHTSVNTYAVAPLAVHTVVQAPGNANCTKCHDIGGAASKEVDVAAMNKSNSIHLNLNSGASSGNATSPYAADSKRCWACHGDGSDKNEHDQARYKNPYKCEDCHTAGGSQNGKYPSFNVTEHIAGGVDIRAPNAAYCYDCHNKSEMVRLNNDTAISSSNASAGHYGKKRLLDGNDYPLENTVAYCNKCHNNGTSVFPFADTANMTIANHSMNYNSTNPSCLDSSCHATGRIHNETLRMPKLPLHNSTYCTGCHTTKERHNSTGGPNSGVNCTECHLNSSKGIHPARYLEYAGTWSTTNGSAANCTSCHQGAGLNNFSKAKIVPTPMNHSTNSYAGKLWGNYWNNNSQQDSCRYCHGNISYHNTSGLGLALTVKGTNTVRMNFSGKWCANCHYSKAPNYSVAAFSPVPPEVTTNTTPNDPSVSWYNHSSDMASNYTDAKCKECHDNALGSGATSLNFTHNLGAGGGGPDCAACHDTGRGNAMVSVDAIKGSMHWNLKNASATDTTGNPANKICWACHQSDGTQPAGHPDKKTNPYNCTDCHKNSSRPAYVAGALQVTNHYKNGTNITALTGSATNDTSCTDCHMLSEMVVSYTEPDADFNNNSLTSHYGKNRTDLVAMSDDAYCNYCHNNGSTAFTFTKPHNKLIYEHTGNGTADIRNATSLNCTDCHTTNPVSYRLHNSTLKNPQVSVWTSGKQDRCAPCHKAAGSGSNLKVNNSYHNTTTGSITDCGYCHNGDAIKAGNAPQNIHSDNLTAGGNSSYFNCYNCHENGFASRVIIEHTNNSGANTTNASMTCAKGGCHISNKTHSAALVKPAVNNWTAGGNDYCAPCHNSSDSASNATKKIYNQGHNPTNRTNDNITSCGNCHNASTPGAIPVSFRLHDTSMTKSPVEPNASTCQGCHNGTSLFVGAGKQIFSHIPNASQYRGNTSTSSYTCEYCHNMTNKPSMHSTGMTRSNGTCDTCHLNNTSPFKSTMKNLTQMAGMLNHSYNGSLNTTCKMCHNASGRQKFHLARYASGDIADPQDSNGVPTFELRATSDPNDRGILVDCRDCHEKYNDTAPFNAPFFEANRTGVNFQEHVGKGYTLNNCYVCHTYEDNVSKPVNTHNVSIEPLSGGPNCTRCHNIGATDSGKAPGNMLVNFTVFKNYSVHRNLTNATAWNNSIVFGLIDTACWVCHQSNGKQPERHPDLKDDATLTGGRVAYRCPDCHTIGGIVSTYQPNVYQNATKIYRHYPGSVFSGNIVFNSTKQCYMCHQNSQAADINISGYSSNMDANNTNISHYATRGDLLITNQTQNGCKECHMPGTGNEQVPKDYGYARIMPANHNKMGSSETSCQKSCHNSNSGSNITLHDMNLGVYMGTGGCYSSGCHSLPGSGSGGRRRR